ncbi:MAG: IS110 family transposase [Chloroflexota bacterium]|nr:IS110 family transposase [Chloroflexota bacterium]
MRSYAGIDLHSTNSYLGIIDTDDNRLFGKRLPNELDTIRSALKPFGKGLTGVVVESTYNWYWLVDGLQSAGFKVHLANPSAIKQYEGLKHTDDRWDSFWLAHMLRLGILPEGYIYPKKHRPTRDLLRRRLLFVRQRSAQILSFQSMATRNLGVNISSNEIKKMKEASVQQLFDDPDLAFTAVTNISTINFLKTKIRDIEKRILAKAKLSRQFMTLNTIPGVGNILALTIMLEVGDISRFAKAGNYGSYCRCVKSEKISNKKKKGEGNRKNGNKYLSWAYVEAAHFAARYCPEAKRFYQRKKAKRNGAVATKSLANKLARASYYMMRDNVPFDKDKLFC